MHFFEELGISGGSCRFSSSRHQPSFGLKCEQCLSLQWLEGTQTHIHTPSEPTWLQEPGLRSHQPALASHHPQALPRLAQTLLVCKVSETRVVHFLQSVTFINRQRESVNAHVPCKVCKLNFADLNTLGLHTVQVPELHPVHPKGMEVCKVHLAHTSSRWALFFACCIVYNVCVYIKTLFKSIRSILEPFQQQAWNKAQQRKTQTCTVPHCVPGALSLLLSARAVDICIPRGCSAADWTLKVVNNLHLSALRDRANYLAGISPRSLAQGAALVWKMGNILKELLK